MKSNWKRCSALAVSGAAGLSLFLSINGCMKAVQQKSQASASSRESVGAYGQLTPIGEIRTLAGPAGGSNINSRVVKINVDEGDTVQKGQQLAEMDSYQPLKAQKYRLMRQIENLKGQLSVLGRVIERYKRLNLEGAYPIVDLEQREIYFINLTGQLENAQDELKQTNAQLENSVVIAPFSGKVLRINAREGEQPSTTQGVMQVAEINALYAALEVYASDASRVSVGNRVEMRSEDGSFLGTIMGQVYKVLPLISKRTILPTDAPIDTGQRVIQVKVRLMPSDQARLQRFVGGKLLARINPSR